MNKRGGERPNRYFGVHEIAKLRIDEHAPEVLSTVISGPNEIAGEFSESDWAIEFPGRRLSCLADDRPGGQLRPRPWDSRTLRHLTGSLRKP
jgi:hypothetical protein